MTPAASDTPKGAGRAYLAARGITDETIQAHGVEIDLSPTSERFKERLGFDWLPEGKLADLAKEVLWFPCRDASGKRVGWVARPLPAVGDAKFLNPKGTASPFIPATSWEAANKPHKPLIVTEGPVKALALDQARGLAIGVGGVWMATHRVDGSAPDLISTLAQFNWSGRIVGLAFDADWATNPRVKQALCRTYLALYKLGAKVRFITWPVSEAKGIDDYLVGRRAEGEEPAKVLAVLLGDAQEVDKVLDSGDLVMMQKELAHANLTRSQLTQISRILAPVLKTRATDLENDVDDKSSQTNNKTFELTDPEPWPDPVDGSKLLGEIFELLRRHVVMSQTQALATTLWVALTYLTEWVDTLPILAVTSPEKRCGKSTLLSILGQLSRKALSTSNVSTAALFRSIEKWTPTLLIDEADTFIKENNELRGILNSGHTRAQAYVLRANGETHEPECFGTWAPKAVALIGKLPETLADRSIEIRLERKTKQEKTIPFRDAPIEMLERLRRALLSWAFSSGERIKAARSPVPAVLNDRAADNWQPLLAIAQTVGGDWLERASSAATTLSLNDGDDGTVRIKLLVALRAILRSEKEFMPTTGIIEALNDDKEAPWADWKHGMTAEKMGRILKTFGVKSEQRQEDGSRHRGYSGGALQPIFDRYLSSSGSPSVENGSQPVQSPANQVLEPLQHCTGSSVEPVHAQAKNLNLCTAKPLPEPIGEQMHGIDLKKEGDCKHSLNGSGSHEPSPTKRLPNLAPDEQRLIYALAPHDYDGGLAYGDLQKKTGLPEWSFASVVKSLLHRDLVYYSPLDHNYHLTASLAEALIARASPRGGVKTSPGKWFP